MKQQLLRHWLIAGLLGASLMVGCNQAPRRSVGSTPARTPAMVMTPGLAAPVATKPALPSQPAVAPPANLPPITKEAEPAVQEREKVTVEEKSGPVLPAQYAVPLTGAKEEPAKQRTFPDITASPEFKRSDDYRSLTGQLQCLHIHGKETWCVRYASMDEEDRYGGKVTLIEPGPMSGYSDGQIVQVEGQLANPDSREICPPYRVRSIQPVSHP